MSEALQIFERAIRDSENLLARFDNEKGTAGAATAEVLKRAGIVMAVAACETYLKARIREEFDTWLGALDGSPIAKFVRTRLETDLKRFSNPNSERSRQLFMDYFEVDITKDWAWANYDAAAARKALNSLIRKRGDAAHQGNTAAHASAEPHKVKRDELEKAIRFLKGLVSATEKVKLAK